MYPGRRPPAVPDAEGPHCDLAHGPPGLVLRPYDEAHGLPEDDPHALAGLNLAHLRGREAHGGDAEVDLDPGGETEAERAVDRGPRRGALDDLVGGVRHHVRVPPGVPEDHDVRAGDGRTVRAHDHAEGVAIAVAGLEVHRRREGAGIRGRRRVAHEDRGCSRPAPLPANGPASRVGTRPAIDRLAEAEGTEAQGDRPERYEHGCDEHGRDGDRHLLPAGHRGTPSSAGSLEPAARARHGDDTGPAHPPARPASGTGVRPLPCPCPSPAPPPFGRPRPGTRPPAPRSTCLRDTLPA